MVDERDSDKGFRVVDRRFWADDDGKRDSDSGAVPAATKPEYVRELEEAIEERDRRLQEYLNQHKESLTEFEDATARMRRDISREVERTRRGILVDLLEVLDNLERALESSPAGDDGLIQGVQMVRDMFVAKLSAMGVRRIEAMGERFDPVLHEAVSVVPVADTTAEGQIVGVVRTGYMIGEDVLRPAGVAVAQKGSL